MDQISQNSKSQMCSKHSNKTIEFLQISNLQNTSNNNLFYCISCINQDLSFQGLDYLLTSQIIEDGQTNIIQKWPPINNYSILDKLIQFTNKQDSSPSVIHQINQYFTQLKEEFLRKVDLCEKKLINRALQLPLGKESILNQYQQISSITKLRDLLIEGENKDREAHEQDCRKFITEIESQKEQNSQQLSKLLQDCDKKDQLVDFEYPKLIKESIFSFIDQIDFFNTSNTDSYSNQQRNKTLEIPNLKIIMKLVSNKSNFCSVQFLSKLEAQLEKLNPLLSQIQFGNIYEQNKNPLDFACLSQKRFDLVEDFIKHQILIEKKNELSSSIEKTFEYQHFEKILNSNVNFLNNNIKTQLKQYIIDSYPLLKKVNFTNASLDIDKFDCFRDLTDIEIQDIFNLIQMRKKLMIDDQYNQSETKQFKINAQNYLNSFEDIDDIFKKYPIIDLMKQLKIQREQLQVKLIKTSWKNGDNIINISEDNQLSLKSSGDWINCVSDIILDKEKKYIFRFSIQDYHNKYFIIGLMQNNQCNSNYGYDNYLSCRFYGDKNTIQISGLYGINKILKGEKQKITTQKEIEMRVWLGGQQLEILDYPNYQYKIAIEDERKNKLIEQNDLKLYLSFWEAGLKIQLKNVESVDIFPN